VKRHADILTDVTHVRKIGNSLYLAIPKAVNAVLEWNDGQAVLMRVKEHRMLVEGLLEHMQKAMQEHEQEFATRS